MSAQIDAEVRKLERKIRILQTNLNRLVEAAEANPKFGELVTESEAIESAQTALVLTGFVDDMPKGK